MDRRFFLKSATAAACVGGLGGWARTAGAANANTDATAITLTTGESKASLLGSDYPTTDVWSFNGQIPGLPIRVKHGQALSVDVRNGLSVPTSVHWHGIRLPNDMDGVAGLTQEAILPGKSFRYHFTPPDAGTFWYHSHVNAYEQVGRGLYGPLIIEEADAPEVDRDLVWMIDDWRLMKDASISDDFGAMHDLTHGGRVGNVSTVNGRVGDTVKVRTGERLRLRLINAANARVFRLNFDGLNPVVIAIDGQPVKPYPANGTMLIGPAGRLDVILDMTGDPGSSTVVIDNAYRDAFELVRFAYDTKPLRENLLDSEIALAAARVPEPDLQNAVSQEVIVAGGAMGGLSRAKLGSQWQSLRDIAQQGYVWAINDVVADRLTMPPLLSVPRGTTVKLEMENRTAFPHPMHLHGFHMKVLSIDGQPQADPRWVDSPLLLPRQKMVFAFVADNPGDWLLHCHALEHHVAGLGAIVQVS